MAYHYNSKSHNEVEQDAFNCAKSLNLKPPGIDKRTSHTRSRGIKNNTSRFSFTNIGLDYIGC